MNDYLQALKDSFVVKSVSPLAATQCPLEEAHRWKVRILHRSPSLSMSTEKDLSRPSVFFLIERMDPSESIFLTRSFDLDLDLF